MLREKKDNAVQLKDMNVFLMEFFIFRKYATKGKRYNQMKILTFLFKVEWYEFCIRIRKTFREFFLACYVLCVGNISNSSIPKGVFDVRFFLCHVLYQPV